MDESKKVLVKIEVLMRERKWTLYRLAERSGVSQSTLSNLFRRNNLPTIATLEAICDAFGISVAEFFADGQDGTFLTQDQRQLLEEYKQLSQDQKQALIQFLNVLNKNPDFHL